MRLLLDTNVLVAAFLTRGVCAELFEHAAKLHELISSEPLLVEFEDVMARKLRFSKSDIAAATGLLRSRLTLVEPITIERSACRDRDDLVVLGTAVAGHCDALITGDADLQTIRSHKSIPILAPADYWKWEAESTK
ncbi:MAG: putative toxin-antitoxin system toxin component, PIN family [Planctomycetes bacterium]|nr:putative toxin-antitoxin system toxin component, PIN family [Planctomycetota bacterium]